MHQTVLRRIEWEKTFHAYARSWMSHHSHRQNLKKTASAATNGAKLKQIRQ
jgi:hypothetical protein